MNNKEIYELLNLLSTSKEHLNSENLAVKMKLSSSSIKKEISSLNNELKKNGAAIVGKSGRGNGYQLVVKNSDIYNRYLNNLKESDNGLYDYKEKRIDFLITYFLENTETWTKKEDLADKMCVSLSQLSLDLKTVRNNLVDYELAIISKPHYGLKLVGAESMIRKYITARAVSSNEKDALSNLLSRENMMIVENIIKECCEEFDYHITGIAMNNLVVHLLVACERVKNHQEVTITDDVKNKLGEEPTLAVAAKIVKRMSQQFGVTFNDDEVYYVLVHISGRHIATPGEVSAEVYKLVDDMIVEIYQQHNIDFSQNFELRMMLSLHMVPLLERMKYNITLENPLLDEIKNTLFVAYEIAQSCSQKIHETYGYVLPESEIAYLALHIKVALNQLSEKKNVLLVCSTGKGSAQLLKNNFENNFGQDLNYLEVCDSFEVNEKDLKKFDAIFTTVPIELSEDIKQTAPPIFMIDFFMNMKEQSNVKNILKRQEKKEEGNSFFSRDLFFTDVKANDKWDAIKQICGKIRKVRDLPTDFEEFVCKREELSVTLFGNNVAFPHPLKTMQIPTFISITILDNLVDWGNGKAKIVILCSFEKGFLKTNHNTFDTIIKIITDEPTARRLIDHPQYETLLEIIEDNR